MWHLRADLEPIAPAGVEDPSMNLVQPLVLIMLLALCTMMSIALLLMVVAHAPAKTVAEILYDAQRP
jgi:hypothetical protein